MHSEEILSTLYSTFDKTRLDPILTTFKSNELLYDFYHTRIFEIITETLSNSQSQAISALSHKNTELTRLNTVLQQQLQQLQSNYTTLSQKNKTTATALTHVEQQIKSKDETTQSLTLTVSQLETQNAMLLAQIEELQNENKNNLDKINELISVLNAKENELNNKNEQINFFKQNLQLIKTKQHELTSSLNGMIEQNYELKNELEVKNNDLSELVNKIEELKLEFQKKRSDINKEVDMLRNENENVLKVKIKALKNKLREKLAIINKLTSSTMDVGDGDGDDNDDMHYSDSLGRNLQYQMTTAGNLLYD